MQLSRALRLTPSSTLRASRIAFVGAGGKTTALFQLARELREPVIITATTHLGAWQIPLAGRHIIAKTPAPIEEMEHSLSGVTLITGPLRGERTTPLDERTLQWLRDFCDYHDLTLLIEADGSRQRPLKAPDAHEPPIPHFADMVIVTAGLGAIGQPLNEELVHRPHHFSTLSRVPLNQPIPPEALRRVLVHPEGGLKNIPAGTRRVALLNQADTPELKALGGTIASSLLTHFDSTLLGSLHQNTFQTFERTGGIILAAGASTRFGQPKQLLNWKGKPFVRQTAETALRAGLSPVLIVTGAHADEVERAVQGLDVKIVHNENWPNGQGTSIAAGLASLLDSESSLASPLRGEIGSCVFLLADQPQIGAEVIRSLVEAHAQNLPAILAPLVLGEKRANPALFDRVTFPDLLQLQGEMGGRALFGKYNVEYLPWHDESLLLDVDTPEDYERLKGL